MQLTENTPARWESVIADLTAKRLTTSQRLEELQRERKFLALDASLGDEPAAKRLKAVNADLNRLSQEIDQFNTALTEAESSKRKAQAAADAAAEVTRQTEIGEILEQYYIQAGKVDASLRTLVTHFVAARDFLDRAEDLMNAQERTPLQQLRSMFGSTLAAAYFGVGDFVQLGQAAMHTSHRQPLAKFAWGFVDRWIGTPEKAPLNSQPEEVTIGKPTS